MQFEVPIFGSKVRVFHSDRERLEAFPDEDPLRKGTYMAAAGYNPETLWLIIPPDTPLEVIVHECVHVVDYIIEQHDLEGCTELRAYLTEYIFKEVQTCLLPQYADVSHATSMGASQQPPSRRGYPV